MVKVLTSLRTKPLRDAMELYVKKLKRPMEEFQYDDWELAWDKEQSCHVRSRGGSKTLDFVDWIVLRVLITDEDWAWLSSEGGQLRQALKYLEANPFVEYIKRINITTHNVWLWSGKMIMVGTVSKANLGLRLDGIIFDEEQALKGEKRYDVYPQMEGMMTHSKVHKTVHLGTLWVNALLNDHAELYPTSKFAWEKCPWLVESGKIASIIDKGIVPKWQIDLLYECIPTIPSGVLLPQVEHMKLSKFTYRANQYGIDFGGKDIVVGVFIRNNICYVLEEFEVELNSNHGALDFLKPYAVEAEIGGYNSMEIYHAKGKMMRRRIGASNQALTGDFKGEIILKARGFDKIYVDRSLTPNIYEDLKRASYDTKGSYLKDRNKPHLACHYLDAFFHAINAVSRKASGELPHRSRCYDPRLCFQTFI